MLNYAIGSLSVWSLASLGLPKGSAAVVQLAFEIDGKKLQCLKNGREFDLGD